MDQLVLLVIIGLISLVNWVMQKAAEKREQAKLERGTKRAAGGNIYTQKPQRPIVPRRAQTPANDPLKELMEALGLPPDAVAPVPVAPRTAPEAEEEFVSLEEPPPSRPKREVARTQGPRWQPPALRLPDEKTARLASAFAAGEKPAAPKQRPSAVRGLLDDRASKRHAVVLAEILGPPRAMQASGPWWS